MPHSIAGCDNAAAEPQQRAGPVMPRAALHFARDRRIATAMMLALGACLSPAVADGPAAPSGDSLGAVVVNGKKLSDPVADAELTRRVETALQADPYFYSDHITIETVNGVVHPRGWVYDDWDLRIAWRLARRVSAGKRVVVELEIVSSGSD